MLKIATPVTLALWATLSLVQSANSATLTYVTDFMKTANDQQNLFPTFPTGLFNTSDTSFMITPDANGNNFYDNRAPLSIPVAVSNASVVYTLINAYAPSQGTVGSISFVGSAGAFQRFTLSADPSATNGADVRDFYQGNYNNTLNASNAMNVYSGIGQGAGGTGNVNNGATGTYVLDEQRFALSADFAKQTLTEIILDSQPTAGGTPILLGVTVAGPSGTSTVPLPASAPLFGVAVLALSAAGYAAKRKQSAAA